MASSATRAGGAPKPQSCFPPAPDHQLETIAVPTRIFLVRHGATSLTTEDRFAGSTDVPLSDEGRRQVASLAERLTEQSVDAIYASPLERTM